MRGYQPRRSSRTPLPPPRSPNGRSANAPGRQVGGTHYGKYGAVQPWDVFIPWGLNGFQSEIVTHVVRYRDKNGIQDLEKAKHYIEKLIEVEKTRGMK